MDKYTKLIKVDSCGVCERYADKNMVMTLNTRVGTFEFEFTPEKWLKLGETAKWFEKLSEQTPQPAEPTNGVNHE